MQCKICHSETKKIHKDTILNKYSIEYFQCKSCGFVQTENPYWLNESYNNAISCSDTGIMSRNLMLSELTTNIFSLLNHKEGDFLDYGGGYGVLTRLMRDKGFNFYWYDKYAENLVARGFEGEISNRKYDGITSYENFEHFENPLENIEKIFCLTDFLLFSTELITVPAPSSSEWWYYCLEHGQHISLFSKPSLEYIARKYNYNFVSNGTNIHIFSKIKINPIIFKIDKIIRKLGLKRLFVKKSMIDSDMKIMIDKMKDL